MPDMVRVHNLTRQAVLADRATVANNLWTRLRGLLGRSGLEPGEGLVLDPCNSIHMLGMRFALDVIHLDRSGRVVRILHGIRPGRLGPLVWRSHLAIELPAGVAAKTGTEVGDQISIESES